MQFLLPVMVLLSLSACAGDNKKTSLAAGRDSSPSTYYVTKSDIKLYSEPGFSRDIVTTLKLNDKVIRYKYQRGFAYVKLLRTGQLGWVENTMLEWRNTIEKSTAKPLVTDAPEKPTSTPPVSSPNDTTPSVGSKIKGSLIKLFSPKSTEAAETKSQVDQSDKKAKTVPQKAPTDASAFDAF